MRLRAASGSVAGGRRGVSLMEALVAMSVFAMLSVALFSLLNLGFQSWRGMESRHDALLQLQKVDSALLDELPEARFKATATVPVPGLSGKQGDALWFLSAVDPSTGQFVVDPLTGRPVWQTNVLFYLIQPADHGSISAGASCPGVDGGGGYDGGCPHKVLVRKVIDTAPQSDPQDPETAEELMASSQILAQLTPPNGYDVSPQLSDPGVVPQGARIVARSLLGFRVERAVPGPKALTIDLRAFRMTEARNRVNIGSTNLLTSKLTLHQQIQIVPRN